MTRRRRRRLYNQVDALLWKDMVTLPLFQQPQLYTWNSTYGNVLPNPSNIGPHLERPDLGSEGDLTQDAS